MLTGNVDPEIGIVDIGCGDGTFTLDIAERFRPASIRGVDPAANAIAAAGRRIPARFTDLVSYEVGDIYSLKSRGEQLAIARGVLHHLDRPRDAIAQLAREFTFVLASEPNGYNPAMKVIEKASAYHRRHDEKSYWPPDLDRWFRHEGFSVVSRKFFCLVPYLVERLPGVRQVCCGTNQVLYKKL
jgi:2-polyprenyl-3-methyl-5-hydroxy-6-metoxy-1,4-benzoquinol methylase